MERHYYDAHSLSRSMVTFETIYSMSSRDFYAAHIADDDDALAHVSGFHRSLWASFYRDVERLDDDGGFAARVEHTLELA